MAAKIAIGLTLDEIKNPVTGKTTACFEPALDYVVVKIPRWPFDKFVTGDRGLGTQMKATGEVMSIDRSFDAALLKAVRSLEIGVYGLRVRGAAEWTEMEIEHRLATADDERLFIIAEAFRRGWSRREIALHTGIDDWFLTKIKELVDQEILIEHKGLEPAALTAAKKLGFSDYQIAKLTGVQAGDIRRRRKELELLPVYKIVDTCAAEFEAQTPYYYSTYGTEDEALPTNCRKVMVLGSGPIRIGQGIEFDYCSVHSVWALKDAGVEAIIVNNNPETVSTDFDTSDRLYFEPLVLEDVLNIIDKEQPEGVVVQFGGQTAINLAGGLAENGVNILGTSVASIDLAEDRKKCERLLAELGIPQSEGRGATGVEEALEIGRTLGFPVLVRPSYVIGGRAMEVVGNVQELASYMETAFHASPKHPILIDKYILGKEVEVDAICDGEHTLIPGIMEHIERAGVHSGDSMAVYPPQTLTPTEKAKIVDYTLKIARKLKGQGLLNIQYVVRHGEVYVLEINPRASRTVPILSKVTGVPMVKVATQIMLGATLIDLGYRPGLWPEPNFIMVKAPVFSFEKLSRVDISLGPEMKSTGEVMGLDYSYTGALYKAMAGMGWKIPLGGNLLLAVAKRDKDEIVPVAAAFAALGFKILATPGTAQIVQETGIRAATLNYDRQNPEELIEMVKKGTVNLIINTPTKGKMPERAGFKLRRAAAEYGVPCLTSIDTAQALALVVKALQQGYRPSCLALQDYLADYSAGQDAVITLA